MNDTIAAIATASGRSGVGVIRVSGDLVKNIMSAMLGEQLKPRYATFKRFKDSQQQTLDEGIALYFAAPRSFTGEDVLELQGHGGRVVLDLLLQELLKLGARLALPGEFSQRAFLNNKIDLAQAESIADLIHASSEQAARSALRSLQGEFSKKINVLLQQLIHLRMMVEAAIDFPEEEIDFLAEQHVADRCQQLLHQVQNTIEAAKQGVLLRDGMTVVIAGKPNAGKSSLLNCLAKRDSAIVTDVAGTTRDVLREMIQLDGLPLHIVDTAGLRLTDDVVEQEGIRRAHQEIEKADMVLLITDARENEIDLSLIPKQVPCTVVRNKIDLINLQPQVECIENKTTISISAKQSQGIDLLENHLKQFMGYQQNSENTLIARRRHLSALQRTQQHLQLGLEQITVNRAGELLAEELRHAQQVLSEITGEFTTDDLLGEIFSSFCIGK